MRLSSNLLSSKPPPTQILLETKRFASIKDSSGFSDYVTYHRPSSKNFRNFSFVFFWKVFGREYGFFAFSSWATMVFESYVYIFGYFLAQYNWWIFNNIVLLPLVLRMILLIWFSLQKFASVYEARLRLCVNLYSESGLTSLQRRCLFSCSVVVVLVISLVVIRCLSLFRCRCHSSESKFSTQTSIRNNVQ